MTWLSGILALVFVASGLNPVPSSSPISDIEDIHCVVRVVDQSTEGEFIFGPTNCFDTLVLAMDFATGEQLVEDGVSTSSDASRMADPTAGAVSSTFTLGTHFDGSNGTGSSISVVGSSCIGGWWNTGGSWANRISSSWNGCYRLRHYDKPNKVGTWADTTGVGQTKNVPSLMNNRTESVAYFGS